MARILNVNTVRSNVEDLKVVKYHLVQDTICPLIYLSARDSPSSTLLI